MTILLDIESRSRCDLKRHGGRLYWEHPSTEALCVVLHDTDTHTAAVWEPGDPCPIGPGDSLAAHNMMGFDRFGLARLGWRALGEGPPLIDTSELARRAGLPGALDALGTRWLGVPKDKDASRFTKGLSSVRRPTKKSADRGPLGAEITPDEWQVMTDTEKRACGVQPDYTPEARDRVVGYCASDVAILAGTWDDLAPWLDFEPTVSAAERAVNDRGVGFDSALARRLLEEDARLADEACESAAEALGLDTDEVRAIVQSPQQFAEATGSPNAQKETVAALAATNTCGAMYARARQALASIARGKLEAGLARVSVDGRIRDAHLYCGAHTWRWSQRGMQLHNMPRPAKRFEDWTSEQICKLADAVVVGRHADREEIDLLLRACLVAAPGHTYATCDFMGVEARALAWCADDYGALEVFASGRDPYRVAAARIFGVDYDGIPKSDVRRNAGKMAELACGYQGGVNALLKIARSNGADFAAIGVDPADVVRGWRELHGPCVRFWYAMHDAFMSAAHGREASADCFTFTPSDSGRDVAMWLPSGRPIVYANVKVARGARGRPEATYEGRKEARDIDSETGERVGEPKPMREKLYGGLLVENAIQALCRDLMADALVRAEAAGLPVVLHVHDELVCEVPAARGDASLAQLKGIMTTLPSWAQGFPIGAAGHVGRRYRK